MINKSTYKVVLELTNRQLGTIGKSQEVYTKFVAAKGVAAGRVNDADVALEAGDIQEDLENSGWTSFMKDNDGLYVLNYMIMGFIKDAAYTLKEQLTTAKGVALKQIKSKIENSVFVTTRKIHFERDNAFVKEADGVYERPLRAMTMQGPRIALAKSDFIEEGARLNFNLMLLPDKEITEEHLKEIFDFGQFRGLGQFRNGTFGTFQVISFEKI